MHKEQALSLLRQMLGADADFRDGQWEAWLSTNLWRDRFKESHNASSRCIKQ
jgi:hypothetical protein